MTCRQANFIINQKATDKTRNWALIKCKILVRLCYRILCNSRRLLEYNARTSVNRLIMYEELSAGKTRTVAVKSIALAHLCAKINAHCMFTSQWLKHGIILLCVRFSCGFARYTANLPSKQHLVTANCWFPLKKAFKQNLRVALHLLV